MKAVPIAAPNVRASLIDFMHLVYHRHIRMYTIIGQAIQNTSTRTYSVGYMRLAATAMGGTGYFTQLDTLLVSVLPYA